MNTRIQFKNIIWFGLPCLGILTLMTPLWVIPSTQVGSSNACANDATMVELLQLENATESMVTQVITVTNASDDVNGDTSSVPALIASTGPDGISFREALEALNNTLGAETIEFAPELAEDSIYILSENKN